MYVSGFFLEKKSVYMYICVCMYMYAYIYFFIIHVKACAIPCPHQPPTRGDNSFGSSRRYCHSWHYQAAFVTRQCI